MIAIIYLAFTIVLCVIYGEKIKKLEERINELGLFLLENEGCLENEADDQ